MTRTLKYTVIVNGEAYEAGSSPEPAIADQITNAFAWGEDRPGDDREEPEPDNGGGLDDSENEEHDGTEDTLSLPKSARRRSTH